MLNFARVRYKLCRVIDITWFAQQSDSVVGWIRPGFLSKNERIKKERYQRIAIVNCGLNKSASVSLSGTVLLYFFGGCFLVEWNGMVGGDGSPVCRCRRKLC